jgi:mono/diheme cytochrome c family protein
MIKKLSKLAGALLLLLVIAAGGLIAYVKLALPNVGPAPDLKVEATPALLARGAYLANHVSLCMDCHSTRDWSRFSGPLLPGTLGKGGEVFDRAFGFPGTFVSRNITPAGIGSFTDGDLYRAITTGVTRDGSPLFSIMPYENYGRMDPEDIKAIIAYVRSLAPITHAIPAHDPDFPVNILINTMPQKATPQKRPEPADPLAYGAYMANASGCIVCHTKQEKGKVIGQPFAGGFEFNLGNGYIVRSSNITPDDTGIKALPKADFIARFKAYADPAAAPPVDMNKGDVQTVMPWTMYAGMTEQDLGAIYDYLRTVPAVPNTVERWTMPSAGK